MNDFDERRRALLVEGKVPPLWIFKEGLGFQNGTSVSYIKSTKSSAYSLTSSLIYLNRYSVATLVYSQNTLILSGADFSKYKTLNFTCKCGSKAGEVGYSSSSTSYSSGGCLPVTSTSYSTISIDIKAVSGVKYFYMRSGLYVTNIWLE